MRAIASRPRSVLGLPFRLSAIDLMTSIAIATLALCMVIAPVVAQDPSVAPTEAITSPAAATRATSPASAAPSDQPPPTTTPAATTTGTPTSVPTAAPSVAPTASASPAPSAPCPLPKVTPTPEPGKSPRANNLCPAVLDPGADPLSILTWAFTPIFQVLFMGLALAYNIFDDVGIAILVLTIAIRILLVPVFRAQIVSQRRMQMLQPELRVIAVKYKGNRAKISEEQMKLYRDRGVNPASGCLPAILQLVLLMPMYQVFSQGLSAPDISSMLQVFGNPVINVACQSPGNPDLPCIDPHVGWLGWLPRIAGGGVQTYPGGLPANQPEVFLAIPLAIFSGLSLLAVASALLQLVQTRMMTTHTDDPQQRSQQRIFLILPLFSLIYGGFLPAGLFIYWITTTIFSIVQQYLINGWGGMFPLFGWTPGFARDHQPRFPVPPFTPRQDPNPPSEGGRPAATARRSPTDSAAGTIRPARTSRRGRRR